MLGRDVTDRPESPTESVNRRHLVIATHEEAELLDRRWWHNTTAEARWQAVEVQRMIAYGYDTPPRLQKILEIVELGRKR